MDTEIRPIDNTADDSSRERMPIIPNIDLSGISNPGNFTRRDLGKFALSGALASFVGATTLNGRAEAHAETAQDSKVYPQDLDLVV